MGGLKAALPPADGALTPRSHLNFPGAKGFACSPPIFVWVLSRLPASPHSSKSCIWGEKSTDFKLTLGKNASVNGCLYDWMEVKDACILGHGSSTQSYKAHYLAGFSVLPSFQMRETGTRGKQESTCLDRNPCWIEGLQDWVEDHFF